jgi:hypothetical protein
VLVLPRWYGVVLDEYQNDDLAASSLTFVVMMPFARTGLKGPQLVDHQPTNLPPGSSFLARLGSDSRAIAVRMLSIRWRLLSVIYLHGAHVVLTVLSSGSGPRHVATSDGERRDGAADRHP